jgi:beta-xylosidase
MWNADLGNGRYRNPILYTDYSDPDAVRVGEDYYMVASSFSNAPGLPLLHSKDLVNWELVNYCIKQIPEFRYRNPIHGCGVWAPSIRYHEGRFFVCFPMPDEGIYMTTATDPLGEWSKPVNIRPGAGWIDPCPFWDDDGKAYLVAGVAKSRIGYKSVLHMVEMRPDGMGLIGDEIKIFDGNENDQVTIEGPKMYKRNGWYYIFAPAGGVKTGWQTVLRSRKPFGKYEYKVVMRQGNSPVNGPHQGAWVDTVTGQDWFLHFQDVYAAGRITHLQPMRWEDDWPVIGESGEPVMEYEKPDVGKIYPVKKQDLSDFFNSDKLSLQWQWNANYEENWHELTGNGLKLNAVTAPTARPLGDTRNILLQKWQEPEFSCVTKLDISGMNDGDIAGYISLGVDYCAVTVEKAKGEIKVYSVTGKQHFDCDTAYTEEKKECVENAFGKNGKSECSRGEGDFKNIAEIYIRYTVKQTGTRNYMEGGLAVKNAPVNEVTLEIGTDEKNFREVVSAEAKAGRWVGVKHGVFLRHDAEVKAEGGSMMVCLARCCDTQ